MRSRMRTSREKLSSTSTPSRSSIKPSTALDRRTRWIYHHYCAMLTALVSLTWEIKVQPDCDYKQRGVLLFLKWAIMQGVAMLLQILASLWERSQAENLPAIMQQRRSSLESHLGTSEVFDSDIQWNNFFQNTNISYLNTDNQDNASPSIWSSVGPNFSEPSPSQTQYDHETTMDLDLEWRPPQTNTGDDPRSEERNFNVNINLNGSHVDEGQPLSLNYNSSDALNNPDHNSRSVGISSDIAESGQILPPISRVLRFKDVPSSSGSSNTCSGGVGFMSGDGGSRLGSASDGRRRRACKRKTIESLPPQSSAYGSTSFIQQDNIRSFHASTSVNNLDEQIFRRSSTIVRGMDSESYPTSSVAGNAERSRRNSRVRINFGHQPDAFPPINISSSQQPSPFIAPLTQSSESAPVISNPSSQSRCPIPVIQGLTRDLRRLPSNEASSSRISSSPSISLPTRNQTNAASIPINCFLGFQFVPPTNVGYVVQEPTNWNLTNESSSAHLLPMLSGGSDTRVQSNISVLQYSCPAFTQQETASGLRGHQQQPARSVISLERQSNGALGVPLSRRSLLTARNRRLPEDGFFDQPMFYGGTDVHDRHRGLRLDVDNMSYEELLALEDFIGNVSTGLSEEKIIKCLKQRKYLTMGPDASTIEEPCCICQEEYIEGEDLGTLDCGHDFHAACIKQWLMHKNSCPKCKITALG